MTNLAQTLEKEKKLCLYSLIATFIWGFLAHGYGIVDSNFSHDSLAEFNSIIFGNQLKIITGRFLSPFYRNFSRTDLTLPWLIGILGLLWCGLAVYLAVRIFQIENKVTIFLVAGIFTTNLTVSSTLATFIHDFDSDMMSLLFSVAAVYCWRKHPWGWLAGAFALMLSLGFYQSYIATTITLVIMVCILDILEEVSFRDVFIQGLKAVGMLLLGGALYYFAMRAVADYAGVTISSGAQNSMDNALKVINLSFPEILNLVRITYLYWYEKLVHVISPYPAISAAATKLMLLMICSCAFLGILKRNVKLPAKLLCLVLLILLPFAMNIMHFLTSEQAHELMRFALWMTYLMALLVSRWLVNYLKEVKIPRISKILQKVAIVPLILCMLLVTIVVHSGVQTANAMYLKKDLEHDAYMATVNRIIYRMEDFDGYVPGETPVVIVGLPQQMNEIVPGFETYRDPNGMWMSDVLCFSEPSRWIFYFNYLMMNPTRFADGGVWYSMLENPQVAQMPVYPADGSLALIDGVLVVKLS